ncbi:MAG: phosphoenolpyruvate carboxykinase (ATP) [Chloroflexota bacterium]
MKSVRLHWNLNPPELIEHIVRNGEGVLTKDGAVRILTGQYTGRSPKDKFVVQQDPSQKHIWWGSINQPISPEVFAHLHEKVLDHLSHMDELYVMDLFCGTDPNYRLPVRIVSEAAYHGLFSWNMFLKPSEEELKVHDPQMTVLAAPSLIAKPDVDGTRTGTFIVANLEKKIILIGASMYSGEVKKGIFSIMNYLLPMQGVLSMHCSANVGPTGESAVYFGLSGTGKTTLSADASRTLIGDDEHGWTDDGIFNFEGGCYAKTINLSEEGEPEIYATTKMFGTILENIPLSENREPDFNDARYTQNTRASYPIHYIPNASETGRAGHPKNIVFLTADAFGVLPPISRLSPEQAMYHFISGYTAKLAGTERGVNEPQATFSACFGAPFMPLHPTVYAELLQERIKKHGAAVWLINTGWQGEPGTDESARMKLKYTRRMVNAALDGELENVEYVEEPYFGLMVPTRMPDVPDEILMPSNAWGNKEAYDKKARELAHMFQANFKNFEDQASAEILSGGPKV